MVSINFFAIVATLLATTVISKPLTQSSDKGATAGEPTYCKIVNIDKDFEQHLTIGDSFKRTKPKKEKSNDDNGVNIITIDDVVQFNSTVEYDKATFVKYLPNEGAVVTKSGYEDAPKTMKFTYSYKNSGDQEKREEVAYVKVDIYDECTVQGSDQWPNLQKVNYVTFPQSME